MPQVNVGLRIPSVESTQPEAIRAYVQHAEALGFHSIWAGDHIFYHVDVVQPLTFSRGWPPYLARAPGHIRYVEFISEPADRQAAATLDTFPAWLTLGISTGGTEAEYRSIGIPYEQRTGRLLEMARIMRKLWSEEDGVNYEGRYYTIENGNIRPKPVQKPGVPIYFGANAEAMMKRVARLADGWCAASGPNIEQFLTSVSRIRDWAAEAGRDLNTLGFVKQHNVSIDADPELAKQRAQEHFQRYYGPRFNIASTTTGRLEQVTDELAGFTNTDAREITLALELPNLDLGHLELLARATEGLRKT
jgi:alkanesulfonate monooxygenase SsuD/methylene tetrahydromethanopterin reductase-like flavin-dependent oxidoreductase (luciferase family)